MDNLHELFPYKSKATCIDLIDLTNRTTPARTKLLMVNNGLSEAMPRDQLLAWLRARHTAQLVQEQSATPKPATSSAILWVNTNDHSNSSTSSN